MRLRGLMRLRGRLAGAVAALLTATCGGDGGGTVDPVPAPAPTGTVLGQVTVEGAPLPGVLVSLSGPASQSTATGADGSFQFIAVPPGSHTVTLTSGIPNGVVFARTTAQITISSAGQQARADFPGEYLRTASIRGAVLAVSRGTEPQPVAGVALRMSGLQEAADTTDASGRYEFVGLRAGEYTVSLSSTEGFAFDATMFTVTLSSGQPFERDFIGAADLFIETDSLGVGRVTIPYSQRLVARGGSAEDLAWSLNEGSRLPPGLLLERNGTIHGTPRSVGVTEFGVSVVDARQKRATAALSLRVCEGVVNLEEGEYEVYHQNDLGPCGLYVQAPRGGAYYRVTMVDTDPAARRMHDVALSVEGTPASPAAAAVAGDARPGRRARQDRSVVAAPWLAELLEEERAYARAHARLRQAEAELTARLLADGPLPAPPDRSHEVARSAGGAVASAPQELAFRLGDPFLGGTGCQFDTTVTGRLVAENDYLAFYEYQTNVAPENVRMILDYYADHGEDVIQRYFGGVSDINGDGVVNVLIRPSLPGNNRAYVWSADMTFSQSSCPASNEMELIHIDAQTINDITADDYWVLGTIVHEMKHVSSLYKRYRGSASGGGDLFHPLWIEEGTADIAKEVSSRLAWQRAGGPAVTARVTGRELGSAIRSTGARAESYGVFTSMARVVWAFSPDSSAVTFEHSRDGEAPEGDVYGAGWHFHRFLRDWVANSAASPAADERLMRTLNDSLTVSGVRGIAEVAGKPMEELLTEHAVAMTFAGSEDLARADVPRFSSYDFPSAAEIFASPDPPGFYPWPATTTGEDSDDAFAPVAVPLATLGTRAFNGRLASSGHRFHDFRALAPGDAAAFYFAIPGSARVIVARISDPNPGR